MVAIVRAAYIYFGSLTSVALWSSSVNIQCARVVDRLRDVLYVLSPCADERMLVLAEGEMIGGLMVQRIAGKSTTMWAGEGGEEGGVWFYGSLLLIDLGLWFVAFGCSPFRSRRGRMSERASCALMCRGTTV